MEILKKPPRVSEIKEKTVNEEEPVIMNVLLLCEALAEKIVENLEISNPSEVDFASHPGLEDLLSNLELDQEAKEALAELTKITDEDPQ